MIQELELLIPKVKTLIQDKNNWNSLLINKYPPIIHRLSYKINQDRTLLLYKLYNCENSQPLIKSYIC